jgi:DNA polymerase III epsilon subunit-like protein
MEPTHYIIHMTACSTKNSNSRWWRCVTQDNEYVNVFSHTALLFQEAGYAEMEQMTDNEQMFWKNNPIGVVMGKTPNGKWWEVRAVAKRPDGAMPDPVYGPDLDWYRMKAKLHARALLEPDSRSERAMFLDTETTGLGPDAEIISIAILDSTYSRELWTLLRPRDLTAVQETFWIHRIPTESLQDRPTFPDIWPILNNTLHHRRWVAYNIDFDARIIEQNAMMCSCPPLIPAGLHDAMLLYSQFAGKWNKATQSWQRIKLTQAAEEMGIQYENAHDALTDALIMLTLIERIAT